MAIPCTSDSTGSNKRTQLTPLLLQFGGVDLDPTSATLWFAGKQMLPDKLLKEYMGRNERTRATVKLQKKGQGPPAREPVSHGMIISCC